MAVWSEKHSLFDILQDNTTINDLEGLGEYASKLLEPESPYNQIIYGPLDTSLNPFRKPIFWWNISDEVCKDIYSHKVNIITIFNPAKLLCLLKEIGFNVTNFGHPKNMQLEKKSDGKVLRFESIELYFDLVAHSLMRTESVLATFKQVIDACESGDIAINSKVSMHVHQNLFEQEANK